ncbi:MAG TPA: hypothetical protein V6C64_09510 [Microcoleaceae cyanobacterium]|jgi:hypothetical protein
MLRDNLNKKLDELDDEQLGQIEDFVMLLKSQSRQHNELIKQIEDYAALLKSQAQSEALSNHFGQSRLSTERSREFREWVAQLPKNSQSLPDEAFDRETIYGE